MMDSQEKALEMGNQEEVAGMEVQEAQAAVEETLPAGQEAQDAGPEAQGEAAQAEGGETAGDQPEAPDYKRHFGSKKEVLERVREIAHADEAPRKDEVDYLKTVFYKLHNAEREAAMKDFIDGGGNPDEYRVTPDEDEEAFKAEMVIVRERRAKILKEQEEEKEANLQKKLDIIERIKAMATSPEDANKSYQEFKALQQQWKEIKNVPPTKASELWRNYQLYVEQYYDLLKLNSEAREYDFKKNLETKTRLCEAAEKLAGDADVVSAFHQLQKLHQEYRETGPVAKELREEIWARFKAASTAINKRHQQHFEQLRAKEEENLERKTALCEKVEAVVAKENKKPSDWEKHTKEIIAIQAEWKTIGFAPQKMNVKIFERFRAACDDFFARKTEFFKAHKETMAQNIAKRQALVEKAKALTDSTEWKSTSDKLIELQREWKTIGAVPKKQGDQLWEEFLGACNHFFEARNAANAGQKNEQRDNLERKKAVIERLKAISTNEDGNAQEEVQKLVDEYNSIGHVPFKDKDKVYEEYHAQLDRLYKELNISAARRKINNFKSRIKNSASQGEGALDNERARLVRQYEAIKGEVQTYENNLGFLNVSSKKGNKLIEDMNRKLQKLKDDMNLTLEKIKAIDAQEKE